MKNNRHIISTNNQGRCVTNVLLFAYTRVFLCSVAIWSPCACAMSFRIISNRRHRSTAHVFAIAIGSDTVSHKQPSSPSSLSHPLFHIRSHQPQAYRTPSTECKPFADQVHPSRTLKPPRLSARTETIMLTVWSRVYRVHQFSRGKFLLKSIDFVFKKWFST